ncbi:MAG: CvpA family protein [Candidatus Krumholzibacteriota bacterium]|nr:CvpA family protein [Candidatus Krumholzibacteriota bacterium]
MQTVVDVSIAAIVAILAISGARRGLIRQVLQIVGIVAAFICAVYFAHVIVTWIESRFGAPNAIARVAAAVIVFAAVVLLFHLLGVLLQKIARISMLGWLDRTGGALLGAVKGLLLASLLLVVLLDLPLPLPDDFRSEIEADPVVQVVHPVLPVLFDAVMSRTPARIDFRKAVGGGSIARPGPPTRGLNLPVTAR